MRRRWIVAMSLAMAVAAVCGFVVAHDARSWRDALTNGDAAYARAPARARWTAQTWLPGDPVGRAMGVPRDVSLRRAVQLYVASSYPQASFLAPTAQTFREFLDQVSPEDFAD